MHVEEIIADHKPLYPRDGLRLPPLTRDLEIAYTALSFVVPQKVRFRYKLEGHDSEWQDPGTRRQAFYSDLPPSNYRFRVIASNNDGVWNEVGATLTFSVAPAWFQTWWFRAGSVAALLALLWCIYRLRVRSIQQRSTVSSRVRALGVPTQILSQSAGSVGKTMAGSSPEIEITSLSVARLTHSGDRCPHFDSGSR